MSAEVLLSRLNRVRRTGSGRWLARCPSHPDRTPSLSVRETEDRTILINCFAGCGAAEVLGACGLNYSDLFPPRPSDHGKQNKPSRPPVFKDDVFESIRFEATIIWLIGCDMHSGKQISDEDYKRLGAAVNKLERIKEAAYGSR